MGDVSCWLGGRRVCEYMGNGVIVVDGIINGISNIEIIILE